VQREHDAPRVDLLHAVTELGEQLVEDHDIEEAHAHAERRLPRAAVAQTERERRREAGEEGRARGEHRQVAEERALEVDLLGGELRKVGRHHLAGRGRHDVDGDTRDGVVGDGERHVEHALGRVVDGGRHHAPNESTDGRQVVLLRLGLDFGELLERSGAGRILADVEALAAVE
jgi:hypothetical protein